jgi:MarR family transcriptional regulator, 2-MHQ and catechol-resistance regulon repressor
MSTKYKGTEREKRALNAFINLMRAAGSLTARLGVRLGEHELTAGQFGVLESLHHLGPLCQKDLAAKLLVTAGNITMVVDNLEKRGLVKRVRSNTDRRLITVSLTPAGRKFIDGIFPSHAAEIADLMSVLKPAELEQLRTLCRMVGKQKRDQE